ncbi:MAG TPA: non-ribosomal peptide synthetase [Thermoanaerobaculia bacterium]|nr:non-ribosomal peptide synthetase [Thermoanaerobaculia bacterium]
MSTPERSDTSNGEDRGSQVGPATLAEVLRLRGKQSANLVALSSSAGSDPLTYAELFVQAGDVRLALRANGLGVRDRVAIALPNGPDMAAAFLTVAAASVAAPVNPTFRADELRSRLGRIRAAAVILPANSDSDLPVRQVAESMGLRVLELVSSGAGGRFLLKAKGGGAAAEVRDEEPAPADAALLLETSGTTGLPKSVALTHQQVLAMARANVSAFALRPSDRCLNVMPLFHSTGLIGVTLASVLSGASVVCAPAFYAPEFLRWVEECRPTWYTAVPTMHEAILARARATGAKPVGVLRFLRSSSSRLASSVRESLENLFEAPLLESYGITETGMVTCNPLPPGVRKPGSVGVSCGADLEIWNADGRPEPAGTRGEIVVRGPAVASGYDGASSAESGLSFSDGWFRTGDEGYLDSEGYLYLSGRLKEMINRGGEKISPWEIEAVLSAHPAVLEVVAFGVAGGSLSQEVGAAVVLRAGTSAGERELREFAAARLSDFKVPRWIRQVAEIPKNTLGKPERERLPALLGLSAEVPVPPPSTGEAEPRSAWSPEERRLGAIWADVLSVPALARHDDFFAAGGDSVLAMKAISRIREAFDVDLSFLAFFEASTIARMVEAIRTAARAAPLSARERDSEWIGR